MKKYFFILITILLFAAKALPQDSLSRKQQREQQKSFLNPTAKSCLWLVFHF